MGRGCDACQQQGPGTSLKVSGHFFYSFRIWSAGKMQNKMCVVTKRQVILHIEDRICGSPSDLLHSSVFSDMLKRYWDRLDRKNSSLLKPFTKDCDHKQARQCTLDLLRVLATIPLQQAASMLPFAQHFTEPANQRCLHLFVEGFYDFWRSFDRYMILHSEPGPSSLDQRPYRAFNATLENLNHIIRALYRDVCENITGDHPRVYRQVTAGCDVGLIAIPQRDAVPSRYSSLLGQIPFIRQVMINPPLIIDPPMNKRTGQFQECDTDPLADMKLNPREWLCFPACVGKLTIFAYFHQRFIGLGCSLANLFELATDEDIAKGPDAIYLFGADAEHMQKFGDLPTVFYDDIENGMLCAAVPGEDRFGYFGYLKKMILTLHNIIMIKRGQMPYHGAMVRVAFKQGSAATFLIIGDTATGKSESLEALRLLSDDDLEEMCIIADDMGSLDITQDGQLLGYGTEIGAFVRLDDLQQGYAFTQMDRSVFMSPQKTNARVVVPVTTLPNITRGYPVDFLLYANNYEEVDASHPIIDKLPSAEQALSVFREGAAMSKGTTTSTGLVHSYFANIFGAPQYREQHEKLAQKVFDAAYNSETFVGQIRTRLGIAGHETTGPQEAANALLDMLREKTSRQTD